MILQLSLKSLHNRKLTTFLSVLSIALSLALFLGVEKMRKGTQEGFTNTISNADLIVGARGGPLQLLLYTIFHIGTPTNNIRFSSYEKIKELRIIDWVIPVSLGDSYRGHRVIGTDENFYKHYQYRGDQKLKLKTGKWTSNLFDVVIGSKVAANLSHKINDHLVLTHGVGDKSLMKHEQSPFVVSGILESTSTPIDQSVFITLHGMEAMHIGWQGGVPDYNEKIDYNSMQKDSIVINQITAFIVKSKNRIALLGLQRYISQFENEPLMAIIPAMTLGELWKMMSYLENVFFAISFCVLLVGLLGIIIALYTSLNERRREMAILRSVGASLRQILSLLILESFILTLSGIFFGFILIYLIIGVARPFIEAKFSLYIPFTAPDAKELIFALLLVGLGTIVGVIPAIKAYRNSLNDGLSIKV